MSLLDTIDKKDSPGRTKRYGRLFNSSKERVVHTSAIELIDYRKSKHCAYDLWFSIILVNDRLSDHYYDELLDVLSTLRNIENISPVYVYLNPVLPRFGLSWDPTKSIINFGINHRIRTLRDFTKLIWEVSSAIWNCFGDVRPTVRVSWTNDIRTILEIEVHFSKFLKTFSNFDAYTHHNCLSAEQRGASILWHLIGRPISNEEAKKSNEWCRVHHKNVVMNYSIKT